MKNPAFMMRWQVYLLISILTLSIASAQEKPARSKVYFQYAGTGDVYDMFDRSLDEDTDSPYHKELTAIYLNSKEGFEEATTETDFIKKAPEVLGTLYKELSAVLEKLIDYSGDKVRYDVVLIDDTKGLKMDDKSSLTLAPTGQPDRYYVVPHGEIRSLGQNSDKKLITLYVGVTAIEKQLARLKQALDRLHPGKDYKIAKHMHMLPVLQAAFMTQMRWEEEEDDDWYYQQFLTFFDPRSPGFQEELWDMEEDALLRGLSTYFAITSIGAWKDDGIDREERLASYFVEDSTTRFLITENSVLTDFDPLPKDQLITVSNRKCWAFTRKNLPFKWAELSENNIGALFFYLRGTSRVYDFEERFDQMLDEYIKSISNQKAPGSLPEAICSIISQLEAYLESENYWHDTRNGIKPLHPAVPLAYWDALTLFSGSNEEWKSFFEDMDDAQKPKVLNEYLELRSKIKQETMESLKRMEAKTLQAKWYMTMLFTRQSVELVFEEQKKR